MKKKTSAQSCCCLKCILNKKAFIHHIHLFLLSFRIKKEMNEMFESGVRRVKNDGDELQSLWFHRVVCVDNCNRLCFCFFVVDPLLFRSLGIEISLENSSFVLSKLQVRKKNEHPIETTIFRPCL